MKTVILGDSHIGAIFNLGKPNGIGGNSRIDDYEKSLNFVIDYAIKIKADILVQTGDLFETRQPTTEQIQIVDKAIKRLSDAGIFTIVIMGNHDYRKTGETFTSSLATIQSNSYQNVRILLEPDIINYIAKSGQKQTMLLLPYRDRRMYPSNTIKEATDAYNKHIKSLVAKMGSELDTKICVGHNFFFENNYFDFGGHEVLASFDSFAGLDAVVMGHYHTAKMFKKESPAIYYSGSMERTNFGDANIEKSFLIFDSETKKVHGVRIPVRDLIDLEFDLSKSTAFTYIEDYKALLSKFDFTDKICRLKIKIKDGMQTFVSKTELEKLLYASGTFFVSKISFDVEQIKLEKDKDILAGNKTDFEIFEAFAKTQDIDTVVLAKIIEEAKKIMESNAAV